MLDSVCFNIPLVPLNTQDHHSTMVEYHVPVAPGGVADIFTQLESNKNALQIKHFSVSQTTLDEVREKEEKGGERGVLEEGREGRGKIRDRQ